MQPPVVIATSDRLDHAAELSDVADVLELRLDLSSATPTDVQEYDGPLPVLLTNRGPPDEAASDRLARIDVLTEAIDGECVWGIDLEHDLFGDEVDEAVAAAVDDLLEEVETTDRTTICSMHPTRVPSPESMVSTLGSMAECGDIAKLAVPVSSEDELNDLIRATATATRDRSVATMATGRFALVSRVLAVGLGSQLVYGGSSQDAPVVEGQPSIETIRTVIDALQ